MEKILKISFTISILGIFLLLVIMNELSQKQTNIQNITKEMINRKVNIRGEIINIKNYNNFQVISIRDSTGKIDITLDKNLNLTKNQDITIEGIVKEYNKTLQIQADIIKQS
jgi:aspartyl/asparaginyl-tRNA synthetase